MERIKIDKARLQIVLKDRVFKGKAKVRNGKLLSQIPNNFDKHLSEFTNRDGLTYYISNPQDDNDDEVFVEIKSKMNVDAELASRYLKGISAIHAAELAEVKEEYNL